MSEKIRSQAARRREAIDILDQRFQYLQHKIEYYRHLQEQVWLKLAILREQTRKGAKSND